MLPEQPVEITGSIDPEQDVDNETYPEQPDAELPAQPETLPYSDGALVDARNAAEVDAYRAYLETLRQPPESRQALRAWLAAQPSDKTKNTKS